MPYDLEMPEHVEAYLESLVDLGGAVAAAVAAAIGLLRDVSGEYRANAANRRPGPPESGLNPLILAHAFTSAGVLHTLRVVIDDRPAVHGVLRVLYVDLLVGSPLDAAD